MSRIKSLNAVVRGRVVYGVNPGSIVKTEITSSGGVLTVVSVSMIEHSAGSEEVELPGWCTRISRAVYAEVRNDGLIFTSTQLTT